jgi:hypothetical protein
MPPTPGLEERAGLLRFQVAIGGMLVEAFISRATCQADEGRLGIGTLAAFYRRHQPTIDEVVLGKLRAGVRKPVVVMASDLRRLGPLPAEPVAVT